MTDVLLDAMRPQPTGRILTTFHPGAALSDWSAAMRNAAGTGLRSLGAGDLRSDSIALESLSGEEGLLLEDIGVAICSGADEAAGLSARLRNEAAVEDARPEFYMFDVSAPWADDAQRTWGVAATGAEASPLTGAGIRLCVLDTGLDFGHPDFAGRNVTSRSFVENSPAQDVQGHGTHCAGTAAGRTAAGNLPRYGVAPNADLVVGKVLNDSGSGREGDILVAMLWAVVTGCEIVSMSLGRSVRQGETFSIEYERAARYALRNGTLVIAAAGNESRRDLGFIAPVGAPANSPSVMAVAALDPSLGVAEFSCGGVNGDGGAVDIAGPGVGVFSSVPRPRLYRTLQGTSMATPHVAGLAALWAESDPALRGQALWDRLVAEAQDLGLPARDVGAGLAKAPGAGRGAAVA
ncbi:S8 family serine peptidase [Jannaschia formosa]|uniref:S8 family serine peptidase n=1 Tax=Jannaschia formosa TaxID=2259592 RepID=UPI000E1C1733|nr:S8 family serine peptidase [Jannaschia formosa]TFL17867.1 protease [Jannaschia formosa]